MILLSRVFLKKNREEDPLSVNEIRSPFSENDDQEREKANDFELIEHWDWMERAMESNIPNLHTLAYEYTVSDSLTRTRREN